MKRFAAVARMLGTIAACSNVPEERPSCLETGYLEIAPDPSCPLE